MSVELDHRALYRLPWSLPDNAISWLEPTAACNLYCEGCYYRTNDRKGHKSLAEIDRDLEVFSRLSAGLSCSFNSTVYDDTLESVPELLAWAEKHIDISCPMGARTCAMSART